MLGSAVEDQCASEQMKEVDGGRRGEELNSPEEVGGFLFSEHGWLRWMSSAPVPSGVRNSSDDGGQLPCLNKGSNGEARICEGARLTEGAAGQDDGGSSSEGLPQANNNSGKRRRVEEGAALQRRAAGSDGVAHLHDHRERPPGDEQQQHQPQGDGGRHQCEGSDHEGSVGWDDGGGASMPAAAAISAADLFLALSHPETI